MKSIYDKLSKDIAVKTTRSYSTSFSLAIRFLAPSIRMPIYKIYAFVRVADEIVDSFHDYNQRELLDKFEDDTFEAIEQGISTNPVLNGFQDVVNKYNIPHVLVKQFLHSMRMDLDPVEYTQDKYEEYILGSAEVVGLMCLMIFVEGDEAHYLKLRPYAKKLGSAFQKVNFLRDLKQDKDVLGRSYFPGVDLVNFSEEDKLKIQKEIEEEFLEAFEGIKLLPKHSRFGVYLAYQYYLKLLHKIKTTPSKKILQERVRIPNQRKYGIFFKSYLAHSFNML